MDSDLLSSTVLLVALAATGFVAAIFVHWSNTVMPALRGLQDREFLTGFKALDTAILNPLFLGAFVGAIVLTVLAGALHIGVGDRRALPWIVAALVAYLVAVTITAVVHLPRNAVIEQIDPATVSDPDAVRRRFDEVRWTQWNHVRAAAAGVATLCLAWALALAGRLPG